MTNKVMTRLGILFDKRLQFGLKSFGGLEALPMGVASAPIEWLEEDRAFQMRG
jgi:hypothetical protein